MGKLIFFPKQKKATGERELETKLERKRLVFVFSFLLVLTAFVWTSEIMTSGRRTGREIASVDDRWSALKENFQNYRFETKQSLSEIEFVEGDLARSPRVMKIDDMRAFALASKDLWRYPYDHVTPIIDNATTADQDSTRIPASAGEINFRLLTTDEKEVGTMHFHLNGKNQVERIDQTLK